MAEIAGASPPVPSTSLASSVGCFAMFLAIRQPHLQHRADRRAHRDRVHRAAFDSQVGLRLSGQEGSSTVNPIAYASDDAHGERAPNMACNNLETI